MKPTCLLPLLLVPFFSGCLGPGDAPLNRPVPINVTGDSSTTEWTGYVVVSFPPSHDDHDDYTVHVNAQWSTTLRAKQGSNFKHKERWEVKRSQAKPCQEGTPCPSGYPCVRLPLPLVYQNGVDGLVYAWQDKSDCKEEKEKKCGSDSLFVRLGKKESRTRPADAAEDLAPR